MALNDYEDALKSYILDDHKLVTYKWLSKEFEIHVNIAKDLLKQYWRKNKDEEHIIATFLLVGQLKDGTVRIEVVKEENLSTARNKFIKIDCEHFYSLQKSLEKIELLALTEDGDLRFSAIKCNEDYVRNNEEIKNLHYIGYMRKEDSRSTNKAIDNTVLEKQVVKQIDSFTKEKTNNVIKAKDDNNKINKSLEKEKSKHLKSIIEEKVQTTEKKVLPKDDSKVNGKASKKPVHSKQSGFNNLFGKIQSKSQLSDNSKKSADNVKFQKKEELQTSKENVSKDEENKINEPVKEKSNERENLEKENKSVQSKIKSKTITKTENKETKSKNRKAVSSKKRNRSQENDTASKRKRIIVVDSSEEDSDKSEDEEDEPMEVIEEPIKITKKRSPSPPSEKQENGKRMISKYIYKTYKDEDGYLVTKREQIYEAVSDNEEPEVVKPEEPNKPKSMDMKIKKKQTTLTNFFKNP